MTEGVKYLYRCIIFISFKLLSVMSSHRESLLSAALSELCFPVTVFPKRKMTRSNRRWLPIGSMKIYYFEKTYLN